MSSIHGVLLVLYTGERLKQIYLTSSQESGRIRIQRQFLKLLQGSRIKLGLNFVG